MRLYFQLVASGDAIQDLEGFEVTDPGQAQAEALRLLAEMRQEDPGLVRLDPAGHGGLGASGSLSRPRRGQNCNPGLPRLEVKMAYYIGKRVELPFEDAVARTTEALKQEGFGIITQIDVKETFKQKLGVEFRNYRILGACNPTAAHQALQVEDKVGTMLPCNVVVQETADGEVEVAAIDPVASMQAIENPQLAEKAQAIRTKLQRVVELI